MTPGNEKNKAGKNGNRARPTITERQENFFWSGVVSFLFIFAMDWGVFKEGFGKYLIVAKAVNTGICWYCFIRGSRKTLQMFGQFTRFFTMLKKGTEPENGRLRESEENEAEPFGNEDDKDKQD